MTFNELSAKLSNWAGQARRFSWLSQALSLGLSQAQSFITTIRGS